MDRLVSLVSSVSVRTLVLVLLALQPVLAQLPPDRIKYTDSDIPEFLNWVDDPGNVFLSKPINTGGYSNNQVHYSAPGIRIQDVAYCSGGKRFAVLEADFENTHQQVLKVVSSINFAPNPFATIATGSTESNQLKRPRLSGDGRRLAYIDGGGVKLAYLEESSLTPTFSTVDVLNSGGPDAINISENGRYIVILTSDDGNPSLILADSGADPLNISYAIQTLPNPLGGKGALFNPFVSNEGDIAVAGSREAGGGQRAFFIAKGGGANEVGVDTYGLSVDGSRCLVIRNDVLKLIHTATGGEIFIDPRSALGPIRRAALSAGGRYVALQHVFSMDMWDTRTNTLLSRRELGNEAANPFNTRIFVDEDAPPPPPPPTEPPLPTLPPLPTASHDGPQSPANNPPHVADDVNQQTGELSIAATDVSFLSRGMPFQLTRTYHSRLNFNGPLGHGWNHTYHQQLKFAEDGSAQFVDGTGYIIDFTPDTIPGEFKGPDGIYLQLKKEGDGFIITERGGGTRKFRADGRLSQIGDRNQNHLDFTYNEQGQLTKITDCIGRDTVFAHDGAGHLLSVTDYSGRRTTYSYDGSGNLAAVTLPETPGFTGGRTTRYEYTGHYLTAITDPNNHKYLENTYSGPRVVSQRFGTGTFQFDYSEAPSSTKVTDREDNVTVYSYTSDGHVSSEKRMTRGLRPGDPPFYTTTMAYNAGGEITRVERPDGSQTVSQYDDQNPDRLARKNLLEVRRVSNCTPDVVTKFTYEPRFQRPKTMEEPRGSDSGDPEKYTTKFVYDYEVPGEPPSESRSIANSEDEPPPAQEHGNLVEMIQPPTANVQQDGTPFEGVDHHTKYTYDDHGLLLSETLPNGSTNSFQYFGTDESGAASSREGYLESVTRDANGVAATTTFERDVHGNATAITDPLGRRRALEYSASNQVVRTIEPAPFNYVRTTQYDGNDDPVLVTTQNIRDTLSGTREADPGLPLLVTRMCYTQTRKVSSIARSVAAGKIVTSTMVYDRSDRLVTSTSPAGQITTISYDERDLMLSRTVGAGTPMAATEKFAYTTNGRLASATDARGNTSTFTYDCLDRLTSSTDPEGAVARMVRDIAGNVIQTDQYDTAARGSSLLSQAFSEYDTAGQPVRSRAAILGAVAPSPQQAITVTHRDGGARVTRSIDANGNAMEMEYDGLDRLVLTRDALGNTVSMTYDLAGNVIEKVTSDKDQVTGTTQTFRERSAYDELNRVILTVDNIGRMRRFGYDSRSNVVFTSDANGPLTAEGNNPGNTVRNEYDGLGRLLRTSVDLRQGGVGGGAVTSSIVTRRTWDDDSRLVAEIADNGATTRYGYDALNRLTSVQYPDGTSTTTVFDATSNPIQITQPNGTVISNVYGPTNRLTSRTIAPAAGIAGDLTESYSYDGMGRLITLTSPSAQLSNAYDSLGRITEEVQSGKSIRSVYDAAGNRTKLTYPGGRVVNATFDALERLVNFQDGADTIPLLTHQYVGHSRLAQRKNQNGTSTRIVYDAAPRATGIIHRAEAFPRILNLDRSRVFGGFQYVLDREDNQLSEMTVVPALLQNSGYRTDSGDLYSYDSSYRLTKATYDVANPILGLLNRGSSASSSQITYNLDSVDNWTSTVSSVTPFIGGPQTSITNYANNILNQVTAVNGQALTYDPNGCRTRDSRFTYQYNYRGQIVQAKRLLRNRRELTIAFRYDALGRRTQREVSFATRPLNAQPPTPPGPADAVDEDDVPSAGVTRYYYDGQRQIEDQDAQSQTLRTYVHGSGLASPLSMDVVRPGNGFGLVIHLPGVTITLGQNRHRQRHFYHTNRLGSVTHLTDIRGNVSESYRYDAYGVPSSDSQRGNAPPFRSTPFFSALGNPFLFAGQRYFPGVRLYDLRARDYDPALGKFLQRDPAGTAGGMNLYAYCANNPVNFHDSKGLWRDVAINSVIYVGKYMAVLGEAAMPFAIGAALVAGGPAALIPMALDMALYKGAEKANRAVVKHLAAELPGATTQSVALAVELADALFTTITLTHAAGEALSGRQVVEPSGESAVNSPAQKSNRDPTPAAVEPTQSKASPIEASVKTPVGEVSAPASSPPILLGPAIPFEPGPGEIGPTYGQAGSVPGKNAHHIGQNAALEGVTELPVDPATGKAPAVTRSGAPIEFLDGPPTGTSEHGRASASQRKYSPREGTYYTERQVAYVALREAGKTHAEAVAAIQRLDRYVSKFNINLDTRTNRVRVR